MMFPVQSLSNRAPARRRAGGGAAGAANSAAGGVCGSAQLETSPIGKEPCVSCTYRSGHTSDQRISQRAACRCCPSLLSITSSLIRCAEEFHTEVHIAAI